MIEIMKAAVYCGTYKKYNEGSLAGSWMKLANYQSWDNFEKACLNLHNDEQSPELMFQDVENLPSEMYTESFIYPEVWLVINKIRNWEESKLNSFYEFCENNGDVQDMWSFILFEEQYKAPKPPISNPNKTDLDEYNELVTDEHIKKQVLDVIKISEGKYYVFDKELLSIEKEYCWGYGMQGMSYEEAEELRSNFGEKELKEYNLRYFDKAMLSREDLETNMNYYSHPTRGLSFAVSRKYCDVTEYIIPTGRRLDTTSDNDIILTEDESKEFVCKYLAIVEKLRAKFEKKIDTYLKKYGMSKIKKWTYWADE